MVSESNRSTDFEVLLTLWYSYLRDVTNGNVEFPAYAVTDLSWAQIHSLGEHNLSHSAIKKNHFILVAFFTKMTIHEYLSESFEVLKNKKEKTWKTTIAIWNVALE